MQRDLSFLFSLAQFDAFFQFSYFSLFLLPPSNAPSQHVGLARAGLAVLAYVAVLSAIEGRRALDDLRAWVTALR